MPFIRETMYKFIKDPGDVRIGEVIKRGWVSGDVGILGVPWDGAVGTRPGSRNAPSRIRDSLYSMPLAISSSLVDLGDVDVVVGDHNETWRRIEVTVNEALNLVKELVVMGGDSTTSYASFRGFRKNVKGDASYILFDAHPDVRIVTEGLTSGQVIRWIREVDPNARITIVGVRPHSNAPYLFREAEKLSVKIYTMDQIDEIGLNNVISEIIRNNEGRVVYVSVNMDVVDPAYAPGVNSPSPGGFTSREIMRAVDELTRDLRPRVFDVVEVTPPYDVGNLTSMLAAALIVKAIWI